jgi:excisionase family DNA binding protein
MTGAPIPSPDLPRRSYRVAEFADMNGLSPRQVYRLVESGVIGCARPGERTVLIPVKEAERVMTKWDTEARRGS